MEKLKNLPRFPFDTELITNTLLSSKQDNVVEFATKITPPIPPLLGDEFIVEYLANNHIQASLVDFNHGEYPWQSYGYNRLQSIAA